VIPGASREGFWKGIASLAPDLPGTVDALKRIAQGLEARRILCFWTSAGGHAALRYGLELGASGVLAFGAPTRVMPAHLLPATFEDDWRFDDLRPMFEAASKPPPCMLVYGELQEIDRLSAENLKGLPGITLHALPGYEKHPITTQLISTGQFEAVLAWLLQQRRPDTLLTRLLRPGLRAAHLFAVRRRAFNRPHGAAP